MVETTGLEIETASFVSSLPRKPSRVTIDLWDRCNLSCVHCCQNSGSDASADSFDIIHLKAVLAGLKTAGVPALSYAGGEPTLHPDLPGFVRSAQEAGLGVTVVSNGWCVDRPMASSLAGNGCEEIVLSVYGNNPEIHDRVTGVPGSFERMEKAAKIVRNESISLRLNFVITSGSVLAARTTGFWDWIASLESDWVRVICAYPAGRAANGNVVPEPDEYLRSFSWISTRDHHQRVTIPQVFFRRAGSKNAGDPQRPMCRDFLGSVPSVLRTLEMRPCCMLSGVPRAPGTTPLEELSSLMQNRSCPFFPPLLGSFETRCPMASQEVGNNSEASV